MLTYLVRSFVPETKDLTLEQLDEVFRIPTREHVAHGLSQLSWFIRRYFFCRKGLRKPVLIHKADPEEIYVTSRREYEEVQLEEKSFGGGTGVMMH